MTENLEKLDRIFHNCIDSRMERNVIEEGRLTVKIADCFILC